MGLPGTMEIGSNAHLYIGGCDAVELAKQYGTPLFVYDEAVLRRQIRSFHEAFRGLEVKYEIAYASKAFCTMAMCQLVHEEGCSLDVVSGGELYTALAAGIPAEKIHMHGNNKTRAELEFAVQAGIGLVVVDNFYELELLNDVARGFGSTVDIILRISPGVSAHTHEFISTGQQDSKFGFDQESGLAADAIDKVAEFSSLRCIGVHSHIGSQIFESQGFVAAVERLSEMYERGIRNHLPFRIFNVGGGFGIRYTNEDVPSPFANHVHTIVTATKAVFAKKQLALPEIWIEPGRSIAGPAGVTLYSVGSQKRIPEVRNYVAIDGGMTDNPRLALYGAKYEAVLANRVLDKPEQAWSVAGKCCESGDMIMWDTPLPNPLPGDILAVFATGAYNFSMASHYNRLPHPAVLFVRDGRAAVVVERETWADVARLDKPLHPSAAPADPSVGMPAELRSDRGLVPASTVQK